MINLNCFNKYLRINLNNIKHKKYLQRIKTLFTLFIKMLYKKNKVNLYIDTNLINSDDAIIYHNSNKFRFKTYVNGIIEIQNFQDFTIRLSIVTSLFIITCPHFFMDYYFLNANTNANANDLANIYLIVSMSFFLIKSLVPRHPLE